MNVHVVQKGTPTSNSAVALPTPSLEFINGLGQPITCDTAEIDWFYSGVDGAFTFIVTNVGVQQDVPAPSRISTPHNTNSATPGVAARAVPTAVDDSTTKVIGMNIDAQNFVYVWNPVNVAPGWYILKASMASTGYTTDSAAFFVYNSTDSSCLASTTTSATSASSMVTPSQTVSLLPSPFPTISSSRASSKPDKSSIVASAVGVVVFIAICLLIWFFEHKKLRRANIGGFPDEPQLRISTSLPRIAGMPNQTIMQPVGQRTTIATQYNQGCDSPNRSNPFRDSMTIQGVLPPQPNSSDAEVSTSSTPSSISSGFPSSPFASLFTTERNDPDLDPEAGRQSIDSTMYPRNSPIIT